MGIREVLFSGKSGEIYNIGGGNELDKPRGGYETPNFAGRSDAEFAKFNAGEGDYGVGVINAARAAMQDYVVEAGTLAEQVYDKIRDMQDILEAINA